MGAKAELAILLVGVVHLVLLAVLLGLLIDRDDLRTWWPRDEGDGGGGSDLPGPDAPAPTGGGLPLDEAEPARRRLRTEHDAERRRRVRRPEHAPRPARAPDRV